MQTKRTSITDTDPYKLVCLDASLNDKSFEIFKKQPAYKANLEHVPYKQGLVYLDYIKKNLKEFPEFLEKFQENDQYGNPDIYAYDVGYFSPTTLRYIKVITEIQTLLGNMKGKKIIEIGVGYGGQAFITNALYGETDYSLVDLPEVLQLTDKYLNKLGVKSHRIINIEDVEKLDEDFDLIISNYAFSELTREVQDIYLNKIIKRSKHGYITFNFITHVFGLTAHSKEEIIDILKDKDIKMIKEDNSGYQYNDNGNFICYW